MKLYVVRHGQTRFNLENKVCGVTDLPLTDEGIKQADILADKASELLLTGIITSPLLRAKQTAEIIGSATNTDVKVDRRLSEQRYGDFEGVQRTDSAFLAAKGQFACRYPNGESMFQTAHRVYSLLDELKSENGRIMLVCHGGIMRLIHTYFFDMSNEEFVKYSAKNCEIAEYEL